MWIQTEAMAKQVDASRQKRMWSVCPEKCLWVRANAPGLARGSARVSWLGYTVANQLGTRRRGRRRRESKGMTSISRDCLS